MYMYITLGVGFFGGLARVASLPGVVSFWGPRPSGGHLVDPPPPPQKCQKKGVFTPPQKSGSRQQKTALKGDLLILF